MVAKLLELGYEVYIPVEQSDLIVISSTLRGTYKCIIRKPIVSDSKAYLDLRSSVFSNISHTVDAILVSQGNHIYMLPMVDIANRQSVSLTTKYILTVANSLEKLQEDANKHESFDDYSDILNDIRSRCQ